MGNVKFVLNGQLKQLEKNWNLLESDDPEVEDNMKAPVKWFNPAGSGTWIGLAKKPGEPIIYGYTHIHEWELGYFSMDELRQFRDSRFGLGIERDMYWTPIPMRKIRENIETGQTIAL